MTGREGGGGGWGRNLGSLPNLSSVEKRLGGDVEDVVFRSDSPKLMTQCWWVRAQLKGVRERWEKGTFLQREL